MALLYGATATRNRSPQYDFCRKSLAFVGKGWLLLDKSGFSWENPPCVGKSFINIGIFQLKIYYHNNCGIASRTAVNINSSTILLKVINSFPRALESILCRWRGSIKTTFSPVEDLFESSRSPCDMFSKKRKFLGWKNEANLRLCIHLE